MKAAKVEAFEQSGRRQRCDDLVAITLRASAARHWATTFDVPLLAGDHVTDEDGTGFVHTAPGHGREDFDIWMENAARLKARGIETDIPFTVDADGRFTKEAPGFEGKRVIDDKGNKGDANDAVIKALVEAGTLIARGRLKHQYPHSWRSKKPVIFRNTPQWFIAMDKPLASPPSGRGSRPLRPTPNPSPQGGGGPAARATRRCARSRCRPSTRPSSCRPPGRNRLRGMVESKPDWVISRQRAWGVPITVFQHKETGEVIPSATFAKSDELMARIRAAMTEKGADAWFEAGARERFLAGLVDNPADWEQVTDILDVWFDSGSTHTFTLEDPEAFPGLAGIVRQRDGGADRVMYLEGSDQHRGWFQSSLLESCGTRGRAPFDVVLTHGFLLDEKGEEKMSKSKGNVLSPQDLMKSTGADILRLWVASSDYSSDVRFGPAILQGTAESYRKLRNTLRWMLGMLAHYDGKQTVAARRHAGAGAADAASAGRAGRDHPRGLRDLRLQARDRGAVALHEHRPVRVLRRHPQGRALLRALLAAQAQGGAGDHRADLPLHLRVAGAADVLHGRGGLARALSFRGRLRAPGAVPRGAEVVARRRRWPRSGRRSSACAAW